MVRNKAKSISILLVLMICLLMASTAALAFSDSDDENFAAPVLQDKNKVDLKDALSSDEAAQMSATSSVKGFPFVCAVQAKLSLDNKRKNFKYYGIISSNLTVNKLSVRAELQYASPVGGSWIKEAEVPTTTTYNSRSAQTATGIYGASWGYWRCKAVGSYYAPNVKPPTQAKADYSKEIYYEY